MSATKRRAGAAASPEMSTPDPAKRRKRNDDTYFPEHETTETTTEIGLKLMRLLKKSQDKNGRNVAGHFLDLPDRDEYPGYYSAVKMPLSLNMIEARLDGGEYETMEKLESDLKRLVQNAKDFNATRSEVYEDAERIRKALSNFMPKHNPAYKDSNYRAYATPIPQELLDHAASDTTHDATPEVSGNSAGKIVLSLKSSQRRKSQAVSTDAGDDDGDSDMRANQLELLEELAALPDSENFFEKPSRRDYPDYYKVIVQATSISDVKKKVEQGKIKDWNSFAAEVRLIWENCKQYNEDGSDIFAIAEELEAWFEEKVQALGASAPAKITLKLGPKPTIKLNLNTSRSTSIPSGGVIDKDSLQRQREGTGQALSRSNRASSRHTVLNGSTPGPASVKRSGSIAGSSEHQNSVAMTEDTRPTSNHSVPELAKGPVLTQPHVSKTLPTPALDGQPTPPFVVGMPNGSTHSEISYTQPSTNHFFVESRSPLERKFRDPGKGLENALLGSATFMTQPGWPNDPRWKINRYASDTKTQTTSYIYLPSDHNHLRVIANLTPECFSRKKFKVSVARNWAPAVPRMQGGYEYDFQLFPGENIVVVDVLAELAEGDSKPYAEPQLQLDFERITFIIMLREPTPE